MISDHHRRTAPAQRRGAALMFSMFIIVMTTLLVVSILDSTTLDLSSLRNSMDYDRALYLANAAVHAAAAELEASPSWRGTVTEGSFPADDSYTASAADGPAGTVVVTASGASGQVVRRLTATFQL